jgi:hypothetical protein
VSTLALAHEARVGAVVAARRGETVTAEDGFRRAAGLFREGGTPYWLALALLQHAELLGGEGEASNLMAEAREIFVRLKAEPLIERCDAVSAPLARIAAESD